MPYRSIVRGTSARPENAFLLRCARAWTDTESTAQIGALLQHDLDWEYLLRMAPWHALMPLLFWHLHMTCPEAAPSAPWQRLRERFHTNAKRNLLLTGALLKCLRLLAAHNIPAIPFKGPVLAIGVYGDLALRQFVDVDLLVHPQDVLHVKALLLSHHLQGDVPNKAVTRRAARQSPPSLPRLSAVARDGSAGASLPPDVS